MPALAFADEVPARTDSPTPVPTAVVPASGAEFQGPPPPPVYFNDTSWFYIVGSGVETNARIAAIASRLGAALEQQGFRSARDVGRVIVYVMPGDAPAGLNTEGGQTSLRIPLSLVDNESRCAAWLARAALHRLAQAAGRDAAPADWAVEALAWESRLGLDRSGSRREAVPGVTMEVRLSTAPALLEYLARLAASEGPLPLDVLSGPAPADRERYARQAFWLLRAIRRDNPGDPRIPLAEAAMGIPLSDTLKKVVPDVRSGGETAALWWPVAFHVQTSERSTMASSPDESRRRFEVLSRFVVSRDGRDVALDSEGLVALAKDPSLRADAARRVFTIKTDLQRANPVWMNAYIAYGFFLEKLAAGDEAALPAAAASAAEEIAAAETTGGEIEKFLAAADRTPDKDSGAAR